MLTRVRMRTLQMPAADLVDLHEQRYGDFVLKTRSREPLLPLGGGRR